jgi:hypothetical protein
MKKNPFKLHLQPLNDGSFTRLRLCGSVVTAIPPCELRRWVRQLSSWSDSPVELVLPVDVGTVAWFELWSYAISDIPARHLQVRFTLRRRPQQRRGDDVA